MGHLLMENRDALIVDAALTRVSGSTEREGCCPDGGHPSPCPTGPTVWNIPADVARRAPAIRVMLFLTP